MASKHLLKLTESEAVFKCYITESAGGTIDISLQNDLTRPNEVYSPTNSKVGIRAMYWGTKHNKFVDVSRIINLPNNLHGHYYMVNSGFHDYSGMGFVDNIYPEKDIRIVGDGPFHLMIALTKTGWQNKIETWQFGSYDNPDVVGS
jgi:hypothetical protein